MPYVDESRRVGVVGKMQVDSPGDLTYAFQQLILAYIEKHGLRYQSITEVLGSLEGAKFDFTDRVVRNYEKEKREEAGDVWPKEFTKATPEQNLPSQETQDSWKRWRELTDINITKEEIERQIHYGRVLQEADE